MEIILFLFGAVCGILGLIVWAMLKTSSKESRIEEAQECKD